ncbi:helix-turn-helix domain-containing protein [Planococcus sp. A6]|uniref:helix-turn-helix domain-containing protein n=1 Tax=Planococcus sp. A6 TaxID=2992760 RepID=UPI00237AA193|nr:helix-turn-helix transcriptional regulator [Planococcus sp. A6]MDE0582019.1 helix-turn-helix domain-containing protein [Planococcus sp. A6]
MVNEMGKFIRQKRKEANMTLKQVSKEAGISFTYLSTLETGKREKPSAEVLNNIAGVLGVQPVEMLTVGGYLTPTEVDKVGEKENDQWQLNRLNPLEMLSEIQPAVIKNIFKSYMKNVDFKTNDYELLNVSEEFLKKITPKEYVDLVVVNHKELLHIYVFLAAINQFTGNSISSETIWNWVQNLKENADVIEKEMDFAAFEMWYKLYFTDNLLDEFGDYELQNSREYSFDLTPIMENDTVVFKGKIMSPRVLKSLRVLLENVQ